VITGTPTTVTAPVVNTIINATAACPVGKVLLGGGANVTNTQANLRVVLVGSRPTSTTVWTASAVVTTALTGVNTATVTAYAICTP
jgi:Na+-translocating ferredoxin:NAD+ oxidoreductase RnfD subunit